jgi:uncharacterized membrane protein
VQAADRLAAPETRDIQGLALRRLLFGTAAGAVALAIAALVGASWSVAVLLGWDALSLVFLIWVWTTIFGKDADGTERLARAEDGSRAAADALILGASVASLVAIVFTLGQVAKASGPDSVLLAALAVLSIVLGWAAIHHSLWE